MNKLWIIFIIGLILTSCSSTDKKQFEFAGGTIKMAIDNEPSSYIARNISDYYSATVVSQMMEGLVSIDPQTLKVQPQIASHWKISDDGLVYEFTIRKDILFHPHAVFSSIEDRRLTTKDIEATFYRICSKGEKGEVSHAYNFLFKDILKGSTEYMSGNSKTISGLKITPSKVILTLLKKDDNFLNKLTNACAAISSQKIIIENLENDMIGTGPFLFSDFNDGPPKSVILVKNVDYYMKDKEGNALPYLDKIELIFENRKLEQLDLFDSHTTDLILGLPTSRITKMLEGRIEDFNSKPPLMLMYDNPLLVTQYYFFNMSDTRFKDPRVRQAFNYAIDREKIGREVLRNQYNELGYYGMVPPITSIFKGYNFESVKEVAYKFDPEKAKKLLADAGFPNGQGFGSINLRFNIDETHSAVADEFAQQIFQNLNINVNIDGSTFEQKDNDASMSKGDIFRSAWYGDYANPETFLQNFYGKAVPSELSSPSQVNQSRYNNPLFDHLFETARNSERRPEAMENYAKAERVLMQDPPIIPLWYAGDIQIVYSNVRNLHFNALNMFVFKEVYKKDWTREEYTKAVN